MNKNESKYFYTASLMDDALLSILEKKEFPFITVKEICQKAGVSRSTFYLHYETMDDLLRETVEKVNKHFLSSFDGVSKVNLSEKILTREEYLRPYLSYIKQNHKIYLLMHERSDLFGVSSLSSKIYQEIFLGAFDHFDVKEEERDYIFAFYTNGVLSLISTWIKKGCKDDIDMIVSLISLMTKKIR